jgi:hypothetical protein
MDYNKTLCTTFEDPAKFTGYNPNEPSPIPGGKARDAGAGSIPLRTYVVYENSAAALESPFGTAVMGIGKK